VTRPILVTGFEPFGGGSFNPSAAIAMALDGLAANRFPVAGRVLPVVFDGHGARLAALSAELRPAAILAFGLHGKTDRIHLERIGWNEASFDIPDNAGAVRQGEEIEAGGPLARASGLPLPAIARALEQAGHSCRYSDDPGRYLCNATAYLLRPLAPVSGFIHVPPADDGSAAMAALIEAAKLCLAATANSLRTP